jgi:hypothetical protein
MTPKGAGPAPLGPTTPAKRKRAERGFLFPVRRGQSRLQDPPVTGQQHRAAERSHPSVARGAAPTAGPRGGQGNPPRRHPVGRPGSGDVIGKRPYNLRARPGPGTGDS